MSESSTLRGSTASVGSPIPAPPIRRSREIPEAQHPDTRPCPPWCWVVANNPEGYSHEIQDHRIQSAVHTLEDVVSTRASLYPAETDHAAKTTVTATFEGRLQQSGADMPTVRVALRSYPRKKGPDALYRREHKYSELMRMTVEDARELAATLTYLADVAEVH